MISDVVCGKAVEPAQAEAEGLYSDREEKRFYFCSRKCKDKFDLTPGSYEQLVADEPGIEEDEDRAWE